MAFNLPVQNFFVKMIQPEAWVRPSDWPVIVDTSNEVQFLMSDINNASCTVETQFQRTSGSQNMVIDWGDGTTDTIVSTTNTKTNHFYTPGTGTPCSRGYTTFVIRIYFTGTGVSVINTARLYSAIVVPANTSNPFTDCGLLEIYYGDGTLPTANMSAWYQSSNGSSTGSFSYLEYVKLPQTLGTASFVDTFNNCSALSVVIMPTSMPNITSAGNAFFSCRSLKSITFASNSTNITTLITAFSGCEQLTSVILPNSLNNCTTLSGAFQNCISLKNIIIPTLNNCTDYSNTFTGCTSLEWARFNGLGAHAGLTVVNWTQIFGSCRNLQTVYFTSTVPSTLSVYNLTSAFQACTNLKTVVFPTNMNMSTINGIFSGCSNLRRAVLPTSCPNLGTMSFAFQNCYVLTDVVLPTTVNASGVTLASLFAGCLALKTITIPDTYRVNSLSATFLGCVSLTDIYWTPGAQNLLTTMATAFNGCILLKSFTMPTSMTVLTTLSAAFTNCRTIRSITFPTTLNTVLDISSCFTNCVLLTDVNLPTSMSACNQFGSTFSGCSMLRSVVLPATIALSTPSFLNTFSNCTSLYSVTFPSSAQLVNISNLGGLFQGCGNLNTLINFDKIGSLAATPLVGANLGSYISIPSISFSCPLSQVAINNINTGLRNNTQNLRLLNTSAGQWTAASPQINVSHTNLNTAALVQLFNDMAAQGVVVSKTINITNATGAAGLTPADRLIVTSRGWTITG